MSWPLVKIGDYIDILSGFAFKSSLFSDSGMPLIRIRDVLAGKTDTFYAGEYSGEYVIKKGDLLVGMDGDFNRETWNSEDALLNQRVCKLTADGQNLDQRFLYHLLPKELLKIHRNTPAVTVKHLSVKKIRDIEIPLPPLKEQKRIAAILDKADSVRRKRHQAIDLADDFLRSVFLDMFGDPISNPKGWEVKKLKEISSKIASGNTPKGGSENYVDKGITFLRSQNVWKNKILLDDVVYIDQKTHDSMTKSSLKHKDILMTKTGRINTENSSLGRAALYLGEDDKANLNGHVYFIRLVKNILHEFVVFILTTKEYRDYIRSVCVGGIDKRQLNKDHLEEFPIIYPPKEMQEQFVEKVNIARSMLEKAKLGLKESEQMFNGLSQKAFAGEL